MGSTLITPQAHLIDSLASRAVYLIEKAERKASSGSGRSGKGSGGVHLDRSGGKKPENVAKTATLSPHDYRDETTETGNSSRKANDEHQRSGRDFPDPETREVKESKQLSSTQEASPNARKSSTLGKAAGRSMNGKVRRTTSETDLQKPVKASPILQTVESNLEDDPADYLKAIRAARQPGAK
jgi:hypothetical protein